MCICWCQKLKWEIKGASEWNKSIRKGKTLYGLIHLGNIKTSEREERERRENEWEISVTEREHESLLTLGKEQGVLEREVGGGLGWLGDGHWGGPWTGWALGVMLYVGKSNSNKKKKESNETVLWNKSYYHAYPKKINKHKDNVNTIHKYCDIVTVSKSILASH